MIASLCHVVHLFADVAAQGSLGDGYGSGRAKGRGTDELLVLSVRARFLYRLSSSSHRDRLVLTAECCSLAAFEEQRSTEDGDLLCLATTNDADAVAALVAEIARMLSTMAWCSTRPGDDAADP